MKKGKDLFIEIAGTIYGYATDCSWDLTTDTSEITSTRYKRKSSNNKWKEFESDTNAWTAQSGYVIAEDMADYKALFAAWQTGAAVNVRFIDVKDKASSSEPGATGEVEESAGFAMSGSAIITSLSLNAPTEGEATFSINLQGTGALTIGE
jgi:predicted secreted protein